MEQKRPVLITSEEISKLPILIVDKKGRMGNALAKILRDQFLVVVVTAQTLEKHENVIHVPYRKKIPQIPDNAYSHIFVIYNGESELLDMMPAFEGKATAVNARLLFVTSLIHSSKAVFTKLRRPVYRRLQIVVYGEVFDNTIADANEVNFFIHQARTYGRIEVPKEGLGILYPILLDDVLTSLVSLAFALEKPKETLYLFPHHVYNEVTVARIIQKIDPMIKVDFSRKKSPTRHYYIPPDGLYFFRDYNLEDRLRKIDLTRIHSKSIVPQKKIKLNLSDPDGSPPRLRFLWVILLAIFVAPLLLILLCAVVGAGFLDLSVKQIEQGQLEPSQSSASVAKNAFSSAQTLSPSLILPKLFLAEKTDEFIQMMQTGESISTTEISFSNAIILMKNIYEGKSSDPKGDFYQAETTIKNTLLVMQKLEAEHNLPQSVLDKIHAMDGTINLVEETIDTWPNILGFQGDRTYLILFQNNMELRPGGGFIGSYGILPINNGKPGKLQVNDVYDADGQMTQSVQPPYGLQRYLGVPHWLLRDSNFDPDFTRDAALAAKFLQQETHQKVNGVFAIDTTFLKNLISVVGPITLPDYNVTVTSDNFYTLTETNSEKNSFPGSRQKKNFLESLTQALMNKLTTEKHLSYQVLAQMIVESLQQKDLLLAFSDQGVQNDFTVNDLSSSLWDGRSFQKNTLYDISGVVDANIGTNKVNYYVKRSLSQTTAIDDTGAMRTTISVTYSNASTKTSAFGGDYRDYVRFIYPGNANLTTISFDGKAVLTSPAVTDPAVFTLPDFTPPPGLELEQSQEQGNSTVGFFFIVPTGMTKTVSITYEVPGSLDTSVAAFGYNLWLYKQPGASNDLYQLTLIYPNDFSLLNADKQLTNVGGKLMYEEPLSGDRDLVANFSKK
ncbi:MAG TPA: DUF4012 domain-containing protein [Candidatus Saccharimonadales bacterium]|nr:DUF4012 domain-containing protein [Candidatus Saccharimonadales bacterium]